MTNQAKPKIRLYVPQDYLPGGLCVLSAPQSHYVAQVMRARPGDTVAVFNGRDGWWLAQVTSIAKKAVTLSLETAFRPQKSVPDIWLAFAPIKHKTELVVEKATELGAAKLLAVITRHAVVKSVNLEKLQLHAIEAAEQCERCDVPPIEFHKDLPSLLGAWPQDRLLLFADESGGGEPLKNLLQALPAGGKYAVLVGPEGGFSADERRLLSLCSFVKPFGMGARILRADTAALAALACLQVWCGDWDERPCYRPDTPV